MAESQTSGLEKTFKQYERHLIGLFAAVVLEPGFLRAQTPETIEVIEAHRGYIEPLLSWAADPDIEGVIETDESVFFVISLIRTSWSANTFSELVYNAGIITVEYV